METWAKTSLILCVFGFLKEFRPSEPYITQYLVGPWKNFTDVEVNQQIFPVTTYAHLTQLIIVFLVTDMLRYKPVILLEGITGTVSLILVIVGRDIVTMQLMSFFYGTFLATEVAYYTYMYAKVDREYYQRVTSHTRMATLLGRCSSGLVAQAVISTGVMNYYHLTFITGGAMILATIWVFFLPPVSRSIYFHPDDNTKLELSGMDTDVNNDPINSLPAVKVMNPSPSTNPPTFSEKCNRASGLLWKDFKDAFTNWYVIKWSIWWALATCGYYQGINYIQVLWEKIQRENIGGKEELETLYNGAVEAAHTILGAAAAFGCGWLHLNWEVLGEATLALCALVQGGALILASYTTNIWVAYIGYIVFGVLYHPTIVISTTEVAKHINEDSYGLIFGVNTFFALVCQTILTVVVAGEGGFALAARPQFLVYGSYFVALGAIFAVMALVMLCGGKYRNQLLWLSNASPSPSHQTAT